MKHEYSPLKKRLSEWTNPRIIVVAVVLVVLAVPMVLWLLTYKSVAAVVMFVITYLSLLVFVLFMVRKSELDPRFFVDGKIIGRTKQEINAHRIAVKKELLANEIAALRRGERTPVLDIWRLNEALRKRHAYFAATVAQILDPALRELHVRVQLGETGASEEERNLFCQIFLRNSVSYLRIISQDPYLIQLKSFFDTLVIEADSLREDEHHVDVPFPAASILLEASVLWSLPAMPEIGPGTIAKIANVRLNNGLEIDPHRIMDLPSMRGLK